MDHEQKWASHGDNKIYSPSRSTSRRLGLCIKHSIISYNMLHRPHENTDRVIYLIKLQKLGELYRPASDALQIVHAVSLQYLSLFHGKDEHARCLTVMIE